MEDVDAYPAPNVAIVSLVPRSVAAASSPVLPRKVPLYFVDNLVASPLRRHTGAVPQILRVAADGRVARVCQEYRQCVADL